MPEEDKSLLEVRDLTKRFGAATALDRVSLTLLRGRLNGLAGPDGAGKTTLIRILTGLLGSDSGEIRLDGVPLAEAVAGRASSAICRRSSGSTRICRCSRTCGFTQR